MSGPQTNVRVTVTLTAKSVECADRLSARYEDTRTDTINRALALYDLLDELSQAGGVFTIGTDGQLERLVLVT